PAPEPPTMHVVSPRWHTRFTPFSTSVSPKLFFRSLMTMMSGTRPRLTGGGRLLGRRGGPGGAPLGDTLPGTPASVVPLGGPAPGGMELVMAARPAWGNVDASRGSRYGKSHDRRSSGRNPQDGGRQRRQGRVGRLAGRNRDHASRRTRRREHDGVAHRGDTSGRRAD